MATPTPEINNKNEKLPVVPQDFEAKKEELNKLIDSIELFDTETLHDAEHARKWETVLNGHVMSINSKMTDNRAEAYEKILALIPEAERMKSYQIERYRYLRTNREKVPYFKRNGNTYSLDVPWRYNRCRQAFITPPTLNGCRIAPVSQTKDGFHYEFTIPEGTKMSFSAMGHTGLYERFTLEGGVNVNINRVDATPAVQESAPIVTTPVKEVVEKMDQGEYLKEVETLGKNLDAEVRENLDTPWQNEEASVQMLDTIDKYNARLAAIDARRPDGVSSTNLVALTKEKYVTSDGYELGLEFDGTKFSLIEKGEVKKEETKPKVEEKKEEVKKEPTALEIEEAARNLDEMTKELRLKEGNEYLNSLSRVQKDFTGYSKIFRGLYLVTNPLFVNFNKEKGIWEAGLFGKYQDPATLEITEWGISGAGGAKAYNEILQKFNEINKRTAGALNEQKSVEVEKPAAAQKPAEEQKPAENQKTPEELTKELRKKTGDEFIDTLTRVEKDYKGYYRITRGIWTNNPLFVQFNQGTGQWEVGMFGKYQAPETFVATEWGLKGAGGAAEYNLLRDKFIQINQMTAGK